MTTLANRPGRTATRWGLALAATGAALLTACSADEPAPRPPAASPAPAASSAPAPSGSAGAPARPGRPDLSRPQELATGLDVPWGLAFLPDGSALVGERDTARILRIDPAGGEAREVYRVPGVVAAGEGGLLGLAVAEDYAETKWVYAYLTAAQDNRIVRFRLGDDARPQVLFDGIDKASNHNGGRIAFGPDGMLYAGTGDATNGAAAQDPKDSNGKILRLSPDGDPAEGNPAEGSPVWTLGHRNVQGLAWDADGTMYAAEFGQNTWDEINVIEAGKNYGWPEVEGKGGNRRYADPLVQWPTTDASPSGAAIAGNTLYAAGLRGERLWTVPLAGGEPKAELVQRYGRLRTVAVAPDGALWLTTSNTDGRGRQHDGDDRVLRFPAS
jgi:glucose/arabinose dehydrogenase